MIQGKQLTPQFIRVQKTIARIENIMKVSDNKRPSDCGHEDWKIGSGSGNDIKPGV